MCRGYWKAASQQGESPCNPPVLLLLCCLRDSLAIRSIYLRYLQITLLCEMQTYSYCAALCCVPSPATAPPCCPEGHTASPNLILHVPIHLRAGDNPQKPWASKRIGLSLVSYRGMPRAQPRKQKFQSCPLGLMTYPVQTVWTEKGRKGGGTETPGLITGSGEMCNISQAQKGVLPLGPVLFNVSFPVKLRTELKQRGLGYWKDEIFLRELGSAITCLILTSRTLQPHS